MLNQTIFIVEISIDCLTRYERIRNTAYNLFLDDQFIFTLYANMNYFVTIGSLKLTLNVDNYHSI